MEPCSWGPVPWDRTGFTPVSRGVPCPGLAASQSPQVCCSCLQQAVAHGAALPRSTRDLLCTFPGSSGKGPTLHSCILCPMFPNTQLPRKCLQPSWRVAPLSPLSRLIASPTPTPELWGTCCPKHFGSNKSLFPADSTYILQNNPVFYRSRNMMADLCSHGFYP